MKFSPTALLVLTSATSVVSFGNVKETLCERAASGNPEAFCDEWVNNYGCESNWVDVCKTDHPAGVGYNLFTISNGGICDQCPYEEFNYKDTVDSPAFVCQGDDIMKMAVSFAERRAYRLLQTPKPYSFGRSFRSSSPASIIRRTLKIK
jgi:hypothetical protein